MGLFSSTKTYVESTTVPVHEPLNDALHQSILGSVVNDRPISDDLIANSLYGLGVKAKSYYRYGRDSYTHGLPEGYTEVRHAHAGTIKLVLDNILGEPVTIDFNVYTKADSDYYAYDFLIANRGWDPDTNIVSNPNFTPVGTVTLYATQWVSDTQINIQYLHDTETNLAEEVITVSSVDRTKSYYHVGYYLENDTVRKHWFYAGDDPTYPTLLVANSEPESPYFPVVPFIKDNVDLTSAPYEGTDLYETSKVLLRKIGLDYVSLGKGIQENPDIDGVDHAYLAIVAPLQSDSEATQEYLFNYFQHLSQTSQVNKDDFDSWNVNKSGNPPMNKITVTETENVNPVNGDYHIEFGYLYITSDTVVGNIGKRGTVTRSTVIVPRTEINGIAYENSYMLWRKQITDTTFTELKVVGLKHVNHIYGETDVDTNLEESLTEDNDDFNLPVNIDILAQQTLLRQTDVLNDSISLCFNSVERVKVKWYQTGIFKAIIIVVAAVISVYSAGSDGGQAMSWAIAITGSTNVALNFAVAVILTAAVNVGIAKLIDVIGVKKFAVLQLIYTVYSIAQGDFSTFTPELALQVQSGILQATDFYLQNEMHSIMNEYDTLLAEQEEEQAELDKLIEAFPTSYLDPLTVLDLSTSLAQPHETPEQYYNTRIHTGNIGALAFHEIPNFVEQNLRLEGITERRALDII